MNVFKAYDVRGKYPEEISEELTYNIGRSMVILLKAKNFLVCQDAREGSQELAQAFMKGVTDQGANATFAGLTTTPMFYYFKYKKSFDAGAMITASHLPAGFNGLKAMKEGRGFMNYESGYKQVEELIESGKLKEFPLAETKGTISEDNYENEYVDFIINNLKGKMTDLKIVVDGSNAMAGPISKKILDKLGVDYIGLNMDYNLENPFHGLNPLKEEAQQQVKDKVLETGAAFGAIFDADGDRIVFIDDKGRYVMGDYILAILTKYLAKSGDVIVHDLLCGKAFRELVDKMGCERQISTVGHVFIKHKMVERNARLGGEISSHTYFQETGGAESCVLALFDMIGIINKGIKLSELVQPLMDSWIKTDELNYEVESNNAKDLKIEELKKYFNDGKQSTLDGITVEYDDYWFNVRKSNTEPLLRLRAEAKTRDLLNTLITKIESIIKV